MVKRVDKHVVFPIFGNYNIPIKYIVEQGLGAYYLDQPPMSARTIARGEAISPDSVCTPFKHMVGSMIDSIEAGADTLIMTFGVCRLGYYGEIQELLLRECGYEFDMINMAEYAGGDILDFAKALSVINPKVKKGHLVRVALEAIRMLTMIDDMEVIYNKDRAFVTDKRGYDKAYEQFLTEMKTATSILDIEKANRSGRTSLACFEVNRPKNPVRVGIVGEYYTAVDRFSNLDLEKKLTDIGCEVNRYMSITNRNIRYKKKLVANGIKEYSSYIMGPTSSANIWAAKKYAMDGYDGIIHVKSATCTPEIDIMPILANIGADYHVPFLFLTFDAQTSDTGLMTRLEAFYDMLSSAKEKTL